MKNKIQDLNNHLYAQLERLGEEKITADKLEKEISRSKAITSVANTIVDSFRTTVEAMKVLEKAGSDIRPLVTSLLTQKTEQ